MVVRKLNLGSTMVNHGKTGHEMAIMVEPWYIELLYSYTPQPTQPHLITDDGLE